MSPTSILKHCSRGAVTLDDSGKAVTWAWSFISHEHLRVIFMCVEWNHCVVPPAFHAVSIFHRTLGCGGGECLCDMKPTVDVSLLKTKQVFPSHLEPSTSLPQKSRKSRTLFSQQPWKMHTDI